MNKSEAFIQTHTGRTFHPWAPTAEEINIDDISYALANLCRWNGHTTRFYSVAEHSILAAREAKVRGYNKKVQAWALLHDAAEAYVGDMASPIKHHLSELVELENNIMTAIALKFDLGFNYNSIPFEVKRIDYDLMIAEADKLLRHKLDWVEEARKDAQPIGVDFSRIMPISNDIEKMFRDMYIDLVL